MKKSLILAFAALSSSYAVAQITINNNDMPVVNDTIRISTTADQWGIDPTLTGANYNWDFSFLTPVSQTIDTFVAVTTTPFAYQFYFNNQFIYPDHKASYAKKGTDLSLFGFLTISNVYDFYKNDATGYRNVGYGANINGLPASVRNIPTDTIYEFPLNYGDNYSSHSTSSISIPNMFYYGTSKVMSNATVDGWGSITTPYGTFNCLRVAMTIDIHDSLYLDTLGFGFGIDRPTEIQYHWLAAGMKEPILQINTSFAGVITTIRYRDFPVLNIGVEENKELAIRMYPNPTSEMVLIETLQENGSVEVYDLSGKLVLNHPVKASTGTFVLNCSSLSNGTYFVRLIQEHSVSTGKLMIAR